MTMNARCWENDTLSRRMADVGIGHYGRGAVQFKNRGASRKIKSVA